jgi:hypothetical protein
VQVVELVLGVTLLLVAQPRVAQVNLAKAVWVVEQELAVWD